MCLLEALHSLIKFSQLLDVFVCDFIVVVKSYQGDVYSFYSNPSMSFKSLVLHSLIALVE
jgi:hypothetical protein